MMSRTDKMSAGNSRAAYMRQYRKRKRLEEDNCNNVPKRSYMPNDSVFKVNPGNEGSRLFFSRLFVYLPFLALLIIFIVFRMFLYVCPVFNMVCA
jgi:hypothetical protein